MPKYYINSKRIADAVVALPPLIPELQRIIKKVDSIRWAAFDLGRVRQQIKQREAAADVALARYEQTVLRALEETDASLTNYSKALVKQQHLEQSAESSLEAASLARVRFENGAADFLTVLDAERNALQAEDALAQSETQTATALLAMYKALGGGFRPIAVVGDRK